MCSTRVHYVLYIMYYVLYYTCSNTMQENAIHSFESEKNPKPVICRIICLLVYQTWHDMTTMIEYHMLYTIVIEFNIYDDHSVNTRDT